MSPTYTSQPPTFSTHVCAAGPAPAVHEPISTTTAPARSTAVRAAATNERPWGCAASSEVCERTHGHPLPPGRRRRPPGRRHAARDPTDASEHRGAGAAPLFASGKTLTAPTAPPPPQSPRRSPPRRRSPKQCRPERTYPRRRPPWQQSAPDHPADNHRHRQQVALRLPPWRPGPETMSNETGVPHPGVARSTSSAPEAGLSPCLADLPQAVFTTPSHSRAGDNSPLEGPSSSPSTCGTPQPDVRRSPSHSLD